MEPVVHPFVRAFVLPTPLARALTAITQATRGNKLVLETLNERNMRERHDINSARTGKRNENRRRRVERSAIESRFRTHEEEEAATVRHCVAHRTAYTHTHT